MFPLLCKKLQPTKIFSKKKKEKKKEVKTHREKRTTEALKKREENEKEAAGASRMTFSNLWIVSKLIFCFRKKEIFHLAWHTIYGPTAKTRLTNEDIF